MMLRIELSTIRGSGHPWIFRRMIKKNQPMPENGEAVEVYDREGTFVGIGMYSGGSHIALRIIGDQAGVEVDEVFIASRLAELRHVREDVMGVAKESDAYRLCNSEGDGLSGLIIDKFGTSFVVDVRSTGWFKRQEEISEALKKVWGPGIGVYFTSTPNIEESERITVPPMPNQRIDFSEHGLRYTVNLAVAHKTGFFLDQRDNRALIGAASKGLKVLDCCCYTGGFSLNAARGEAAEVIGVDLDEDAVEAATKNAARNNLKAKFIHSDVFPYLRDRVRYANFPDMIILDPPKVIHSRDDYSVGLRKYYDLNRTALSSLQRGGFLFTFSCSGRLTEEAFLKVISESAFDTRKTFQVLRITGAGPDHPYLLNAPETRYLKGVFGRLI
ncbi:MAG: class I SAM-dependent rRNA methyltransferase [Candidatus Brocadiia bacterium]